MEDYHLFVGIDIAAKTFTATWRSRTTDLVKPFTLPQTPEGFQRLMQQLATMKVAAQQTLVVLEATGSYWIALAVALHEAGYQVSVVNPTHLHNYAKSLPRRSKTDPRDAALLAQFALERQPAVWTPPPTVYHELRQRLVARDGLLEMRAPSGHRHAINATPCCNGRSKLRP